MIEIKLKGMEKVLNGLDNFKTNLSQTGEPLTKSSQYMQLEASANFPAQGSVFDEKWDSLKPSTVKRKEKAGFGSMPMMVRTGELFRSFFVNISAP